MFLTRKLINLVVKSKVIMIFFFLTSEIYYKCCIEISIMYLRLENIQTRLKLNTFKK